MISTIICYDDNDSELGDYFLRSHSNLIEFLSENNQANMFSLCGLDCTETKLIDTIDSFNNMGFVVVGLLHGNEEQLLTENDILVDSDRLEHFVNSIVYTPACSTAQKLGVDLIKNGALGYIGCLSDTLATYEDYFDLYIESELYCLKEFYRTNKSLSECFNNMLTYFDSQIDMLVDQNDVLVAMELTNNKDSFVLFGNGSLTRNIY